jgi:hypothetical protein
MMAAMRGRALAGTVWLLAVALGADAGHAAFGDTHSAIPDPAAYCDDLLRVTDLAATSGKLTFIAGKAREGSFLDTTLPLAGWSDCSLYGPRTYICEFGAFATAVEAEKALDQSVKDVKACLGHDWAEDTSRSSPDYVQLHSERDAVSLTLSTDAGQSVHVVRLIVFVRGR